MKLSVHLATPVLLLLLAQTQADATAFDAKRYAASTDLREYVEQRASAPQQASFFYAYWARWECFDDGGIARRIAKESSPPPGSARGEATRIQLERCRGLPPEFNGASLQRDDVDAGRAAGDRLFAAFQGSGGTWFSVSSQADLARALQFVKPTEDPNIVWVVSQQVAGLGVQGRLTVNGRRLTEPERRSLHTAFFLAACDLNVDCGPSHRWMRTWCIQNAECDDRTIEGYWRRRDLNEPNKMDWKVIDSYRRLITAAARAGDWSAFALVTDR